MNPLPILIALVAGIGLGAVGAGSHWSSIGSDAGHVIGGLWLNGMKMTIVPLVVSLLITGIAKMAEAARAGRLAVRAILSFLAVLWSSSLLAAVMVPFLTRAWPLDRATAASLTKALFGEQAVGAPPAFKDFFLSMVPANPLAAATNDAILPLIIFTAIFAFAMLRLPEEKRQMLTGFFETISLTMLTIIGWVLALAPIGVFALAFVTGAQAGWAALGALAHYVIVISAVGAIVWLSAWPVALIFGRVGFVAFSHAILPSQAVAISTQSSLASLPAMLKATQALGVPEAKADIILPLAVALFRATGPAMNLGVALYVAHWYGIELSWGQIAFGVAAGATTTLGAVSLPGQLSFISSIAPISVAMGVPVNPLALLVGVEPLPDIMRTMGNVSMDVAVTTAVARHAD